MSVFAGSHKHDRLPIPYGKGEAVSGVSRGLFTRLAHLHSLDGNRGCTYSMIGMEGGWRPLSQRFSLVVSHGLEPWGGGPPRFEPQQ